jgi:hypothetical protein
MKFTKPTRDLILFLTGVGGVLHETLRTSAERPTLLILYASMMGLPVFLSRDKDKDDE